MSYFGFSLLDLLFFFSIWVKPNLASTNFACQFFHSDLELWDMGPHSKQMYGLATPTPHVSPTVACNRTCAPCRNMVKMAKSVC